MSTAKVATLTKLLETIPDPWQDRVIEHLREYVEDLRDELHWDAQFEESGAKLSAVARKARAQIAKGEAEPMDLKKL